MLRCRFCSHTTREFKEYITHRKIHGTSHGLFICGYGHCRRRYRTQESIRSHLIRTHEFKFKDSTLKIRLRTDCADAHGKYVCSDNLCNKQCDSSFDLIKHMKIHIRNGSAIKCPFKRCNSVPYKKIGSFSSHISRYHRTKNVYTTVENCENGNTYQLNEPDEPCENVDQSNVQRENISEFDITENEGVDRESRIDPLLQNMALLFLKLESHFCIPSSTVQFIATQMINLHNLGEEQLKKKILPNLLNKNLSREDAHTLLDQILECNPFSSSKSLDTSYKRDKFYRTKFPYIQPIAVKLTGDSETKKPTFFHYVPIDQTLKKTLQSEYLRENLVFNTEERNDNVLRDFTDGLVFKRNRFFQENPNALKLILYQDGVEVVNPLGSAKTKHKILAVYLSIGNLPDYLRSRINSIQLVALCKEKEFDHEKVYGRIVEDLKKIEVDGIELASGEVIKGALVFIAGDNLGSHALAGLTTNFSTAPYLCRYCVIIRKDFHANVEAAAESYEKRTPELHRNIIEQMKNDELDSDNDRTSIDSKGIQFDSAFNRLNYYHVANPGLPPCLGHDIFECFITYDVKLFIDKLIRKNKWFSYDLLNKRIQSFPYSTEDQRDKPNTIQQQSKKITGGAWQLWTFLRLLPLMIEDKIRDADDESWRAILLLTEIIEIIIAPSIHTSCLPYLKSLISDYINLREKIPVPLRPKHHFLQHYPYLILQFGPLMKVWTLRFESKHRFFKRVIAMIKNFINVTQSLSHKHELYQSYIRMGGDLKCLVDAKVTGDFCRSHYNEKIQQVVNSIPQTCQECSSLTLKGICYRKGDAVFTSYEAYQYNIEVGRIVTLLYDDPTDNVFAVVEILQTTFLKDLRAYQLGSFLRYQCINLKFLPSNEKLHMYNTGSVIYVKPNYGLVQKGL